MRIGILVLSGLLSVTADAFQWSSPVDFSLKIMFGVCLCGVVAQGLNRMHAADAGAGVFHLESSRLVRRLYLSLYILAAARVCYSAAGGDDIFRVFTHLAADRSLTDFQFYIGCVFAAVCVIRLSPHGRRRPQLGWAGELRGHAISGRSAAQESKQTI